MKSISKCVLSISALVALTLQPVRAQVTEAMQQSAVRIITLARNSSNPALPASESVSFSNGDTYYDYDWGLGTGFVINQDGFVLTNNHVVATKDTSDESTALVLVLQKAGDRYFLHRATVEKLDPNADVAILHAPALKATPFAFSLAYPTEGQDVFSVGFPGSGDVAVTRSEREIRFANELYEWRLSTQKQEPVVKAALQDWIAEFPKKNGRLPTQKELSDYETEFREAYKKHWESVYLAGLHGGYAELGDFLHDLDLKLQANPNANVWDVTDVMTQGLRPNYIKPTVTRGNAERITEKPGWLNSAVTIPAIQHNLHIMHGNSGGPLLNGGGHVIGIVGRGTTGKISNGVENTEQLDWATTSGYLMTLLQSRHISFIVGPSWNGNTGSVPVWLIVVIAIAVAIAITALVVGLILVKTRRKSSVTQLIEALKGKGHLAGTQLIELLAGKSRTRNRSAIRPAAAGSPKTWKFDGRTSAGRTFQIAINEAMFARNGSRLILGRSADLCDLVIDDETVSRQHAEIRRENGAFKVADRNSSNGTAVNGVFSQKPFQPVPFKLGDTLTLGEVKLDFGRD
jgi:S1-C subfamily serine protease